ncbi:MAG: hypothetical protein AAB414_02980 [Patescibacteria group bacterium]
MAKYDNQITELKNLLPNTKNILIALPTDANIDKLAAGLALFLVLTASGKKVSIVTSELIKVGQAYLFGVNHIQNTLSQTEGGNLTLTLEGVASSDNTVPALEKLDWYAQNGNLNLVFHVLPGQTFQPAKIVPHYQGSGFDVIFVIGAANLNTLGNIYSQNQQAFSGTHIVNISQDGTNTGFGQTNILDTQASSISEVVVNLFGDLGFNLDQDSASNLLAGIFDATVNLTDAKTAAETYMAVATCLRVGGRKPSIAMGVGPSGIAGPQPDLSALLPKEPVLQSIGEFTTPPVVSVGDDYISAVSGQPSPEERPLEEGVVTETPEPDWLTPKIFKGSSLG